MPGWLMREELKIYIAAGLHKSLLDSWREDAAEKRFNKRKRHRERERERDPPR